MELVPVQAKSRKKPGLQPTEAKGNAKNKHSPIGKDPAFVFSAEEGTMQIYDRKHP